MKKNFNFAFAALAAFAMVLSCSKVEEPEITQNGGSDSLGQTTISATLSDALTKVAFTPSYDTDGKPSQLALAWEADDKLRVYDNADKTKYEDFSLDPACVGQKTGSFTGNLFSAESYYVEVINGDLEYAVQTQPADGVTTSLKYLASASAVTDLKAVEFTEYSSVLAITAKMPEGAAAGIASVVLSASEAIFSTGKTLKIQLDQVGDAGEDGVLNLFATLPKGNQQIAEGTTLLVTFNAPDTDHTVYTRFVELGSQTFTAGKLNTININATQSDKHAGLISCDGSSAEKAYLIGDKYQMQAMGSLMEADATTYFELVDDIDLDGSAWTSLNGKVNLKGNSKTISNLDAPLFDDLNGTVSDFIISGAEVSSPNTVGILANTVGTAASKVSGVTICDSKLTSAPEEDIYIGGMVGEVATAASFDDCHVVNTTIDASSSGDSYVGGAFGYIHNEGATIGTTTKCTVTSSELEANNYAGGFIGYINGGVVKNNEVDCNVNAKSTISAFLAKMENGTLEGNVVSGDVSGKQTMGGLVGYVSAGSIKSNHTTGTVTGTAYYIGGLIGELHGGVVDDCYATGNISSTSDTWSRVGGLVGHVVGGEVKNSYYSTGTVTATGKGSGGFIGTAAGGSVHDCYSTGTVSTTAYYGAGLIGAVGASMTVADCYFSGTVSTTSHYGSGLIGQHEKGNLVVSKCYVTGNVAPTGSNANYAGIVAHPASTTGNLEIKNCYVTGNITGGKRWSGGILGSPAANTVIIVTNCYSTALIQTSQQAGALVGNNNSSNITCTGFIGWTTVITTMNATGNTVTIGDNNYLGKEGTISAKAKEFNWDETIWDLSGEEPRLSPCAAPDDAVIEWPDPIFDGAEVVNLCNGVEWTSFHGLWEGQIRNINIVKTRLNSHNRLGIYYEYGADDDYLPKKCEYLDALVGTNGPMACCHFVKVDGTVKRVANAQSPWVANCALTIDNNVPDIVKVADNYAAAELPNSTVGTGGPLLVWDGQIQTYDQYEKEDTDAWLTTTHPRTALGLTKDRKTVIQVTVDGRWEGTADKTAVGMSVSTLAKLMKELGCDKALNFDGGGGTAMWVYGYGVNGIVNHPCESPKNWDNPTLRTTGNAVYIYSDLK